MYKSFLAFAFVAFSVVITGCGGSGSNQTVGEDADAKAFADYEASQKASEDAMNESMKAAPPAN